MSNTSRTADWRMFAARSEKSSSWRCAEVAARSIASMASAGSVPADASSVSWVTEPEYNQLLLQRQHLLIPYLRFAGCGAPGGAGARHAQCVPGTDGMPGGLGCRGGGGQ